MSDDLIDVMLCINNPDNGNYCGRIAGIHIDDFANIDPTVLPEPRCTLGDGYFSVHRRRFVFHNHQPWVGNWCWDSISVTPNTMVRLVEHVLSQRWRSPSTGEVYCVWGFDCATENAIQLADAHRKGETVTYEALWQAWRKNQRLKKGRRR